MSDPIADIIIKEIFELGDEPSVPCTRIAYRGGGFPDSETDNGGMCKEPFKKMAKDIAKQIRQQIGRELLETFMKRAMWGNRGIEIVINEICQLDIQE